MRWALSHLYLGQRHVPPNPHSGKALRSSCRECSQQIATSCPLRVASESHFTQGLALPEVAQWGGKCRGIKAWPFGPKQASSDKPLSFRAPQWMASAEAVVRPALWLDLSLCSLLLFSPPSHRCWQGTSQWTSYIMTSQSVLPGKQSQSEICGRIFHSVSISPCCMWVLWW